EAKQEEVFNVTIQPLVADALNGINHAIMAYGQTSSGKTYTMVGPEEIDEETQGLIPRFISALFEGVGEMAVTQEFQLSATYVEIYNECINDLLDQRKQNLVIREGANGIFIENVSEHPFANEEEFLTLIDEGNENRVTSANQLNERSSRSHAICTVQIEQKDTLKNSIKKSQFHLVDLAGSEKINFTASELLMKEAAKINTSLFTLGKVIMELTKDASNQSSSYPQSSSSSQTSFISYRDSKLTRLLKESLGGNSKTKIIICVSSSTTCLSETLSTLKFGKSAKQVKNTVHVNQERTSAQMKKIIAQQEKEIERLKLTVQQLLDVMHNSDINLDSLSGLINTIQQQSPPSQKSSVKFAQSDENDDDKESIESHTSQKVLKSALSKKQQQQQSSKSQQNNNNSNNSETESETNSITNTNPNSITDSFQQSHSPVPLIYEQFSQQSQLTLFGNIVHTRLQPLPANYNSLKPEVQRELLKQRLSVAENELANVAEAMTFGEAMENQLVALIE
ncbi:MAG: putative Kinesin heavy chain, partial [Streblomastix strix]